MNQNLLVQIRELRHHYQLGASRVEVLRSVDLHVHKGEFVAIMGSSGSGKSTLLHVLGCLLRPYGGSYLLGDTDVLATSGLELARVRGRRIGLVFQMFHLLPEMTVSQNVALPFLYNDIAPDQARSMVDDAIAKTGLAHRAGHKPMELSGGEMQRAAIARAIAVDPELILADEPTGNLDSTTGNEILNLFEELHAAGRTIIMVTHDHAIAAHAERILVLKDGSFQ